MLAAYADLLSVDPCADLNLRQRSKLTNTPDKSPVYKCGAFTAPDEWVEHPVPFRKDLTSTNKYSNIYKV
jgi:hypothetical protein